MHGDVTVDPRLQGRPIDFDAAEIEDEAVAQRRVDMVFFVRGGQLRRAPENGFADRLSDPVGQCAWRPVAERRDAGKRYFVVGIAFRADAATGERDIVDFDVQLARGDPRHPFGKAPGAEFGGAGTGGRATRARYGPRRSD